MKNVVYIGTSNKRAISSDVLEKYSISHADMEFVRGQAIEVSNEVAELLLGDAFSGEFAEATKSQVAAEPQENVQDTPNLLVNLEGSSTANDSNEESSESAAKASARKASAKSK